MTAEQPETFVLPPDELMPKSPLPVVIYRNVEVAGEPTRDFETLFEANGWRGSWRNGVYDFDHYHSNAHEVLGVARGNATLQLGGDDFYEDLTPENIIPILDTLKAGKRPKHGSQTGRVSSMSQAGTTTLVEQAKAAGIKTQGEGKK